ncbi:MAG: PEP-CTERM sorting domain-containing protein [Kiritimatiellia bacterium]
MKKIIGIVGAVLMAVSVMAAPTQVIMGTTWIDGIALFDSDGITAAADGWYVEVILSNTGGQYNSDTFNAYTVVANYVGLHQIGSMYDNSEELDPGHTVVQWDNAAYGANVYATFRFYNNAVKASATKYGVLSGWQHLENPAPGESYFFPDGSGAAKYDYPVAIPEPATMTLVGLGGLAMVLRRKMRKA